MPLSRIEHALLRKASEQVRGGVEHMDPIAAIDDLPLRSSWPRRADAADATTTDSTAPPLATDTHTQHLLPTSWDHRRLAAETQVAEARAAATQVEREVPALARRAAAQLGTEQTATIAEAEVAMQIEHDDIGMAWLGVRVVGPADANLHAVLLVEVPETAKDDWVWDDAACPAAGCTGARLSTPPSSTWAPSSSAVTTKENSLGSRWRPPRQPHDWPHRRPPEPTRYRIRS